MFALLPCKASFHRLQVFEKISLLPGVPNLPDVHASTSLILPAMQVVPLSSRYTGSRRKGSMLRHWPPTVFSICGCFFQSGLQAVCGRGSKKIPGPGTRLRLGTSMTQLHEIMLDSPGQSNRRPKQRPIFNATNVLVFLLSTVAMKPHVEHG